MTNKETDKVSKVSNKTSNLSSPELVKRTSIYPGAVVNLSLDKVKLPNDLVVELERVRHPGAAAMVPICESGEVLLVRQYRYATGGFLLEIPAGKLDSGEEPKRCAHRELVEEVGRKAGSLVSLGWIWTTPGFSDEKIWLYLAQDLKEAEQSLEEDEVLSVERFPLERAVQMAQTGEIVDGKTICGLLRAWAYFQNQK